MCAKLFSFTDIIDPMSAEEFFSSYWEKKPLHIPRSNTQFYKDILTLEHAQAAIAFGGLRYPAIQLSKSGGFLHPDVFCTDIHAGDIVFTGVPDIDRIQTEYRSGASISLPGFNRTWQPLRNLAAAVETYLDHAVHTNIYITPGNTAGFKPHYDAHEVFVLQISGRKHWKIYDAPIDLPHRTQQYQPQIHTTPATPLLELDMNPGDLLYMPRGFVHTTHTSDSASMHITLGVTVYTYVELFSTWLQSSKKEVDFRRALPPGFASRPELQQGMEEEFSRLVKALSQQLDSHQLISAFQQQVRSGYPGQCGFGKEFDLNAVVITPTTQVKAIPHNQYTYTEEGDNIVLKFDGKTLLMSRSAWFAVEKMCKHGSFKPLDLPAAYKEETKLALIRHLYQEGFLMLNQNCY